MEDIKKIEQEILNRELKIHIEKKVMLELQINLQGELDPQELSAKRPLRFGSNGQPISWEEIKRAEHIEMLKQKLEDEELVLKIIKERF